MTAPFDSMLAENRIRVLTWMRDGLTKGLKKMCETICEHWAVKSGYGGPAINVTDIWNSFGTETYDRFAECQTHLDTIDTLIVEAQAEIAARGFSPAGSAEPTKKIASGKRSRKKRGER